MPKVSTQKHTKQKHSAQKAVENNIQRILESGSQDPGRVFAGKKRVLNNLKKSATKLSLQALGDSIDERELKHYKAQLANLSATQARMWNQTMTVLGTNFLIQLISKLKH